MEIFSKKLVRDKDLEKKIKIACSFNYSKCDIKQGRIISVGKTNVSFIEPHRINIRCKNKTLLLLYFDKDNLFLYDRSIQITIAQLINILKELKGC